MSGPLDNAAGIPGELPLDPPAADEDGIADILSNAHENAAIVYDGQFEQLLVRAKALQVEYKAYVQSHLESFYVVSTDTACECLANAINELGG